MTEPVLDTPQTRTHDGRTMIGHVVICAGDDDVVAVWQVNTAGTNTGAWTFPAASVRTDPVVARRLLDQCVRRAPAAWDPSVAITTLRAAEGAAAVAGRDWGGVAVTVPAVLAEIAAVRAGLDKRIAEERQVKKNTVPAEWEADIPDPVPATAEELRAYARLVAPPGGGAVQEALLTAALLRWSLRRWRENMTVLGRRDYLQHTFGRPRALPAEWEKRLADAYAADAW